MKLEHRLINTVNVYQTPLIFQNEELNFIVVMLCWGDNSRSNQVLELLKDYIQSALADVEVTTPFEVNTALSKEENIIRIALLLANNFVHKDINANEYNTGYELLILHKKANTLSWGFVGNFDIYKGTGNHVVPLYIEEQQFFSKKLLGVENNCYPNLGHHILNGIENYYLLRHNGSAILKSEYANTEIGSIIKNLIHNNQNSSFWIGQLETNF